MDCVFPAGPVLIIGSFFLSMGTIVPWPVSPRTMGPSVFGLGGRSLSQPDVTNPTARSSTEAKMVFIRHWIASGAKKWKSK